MLTPQHTVSFGCASLAGLLKPISEEEAHGVLDAAWSLGIRYFDTAPYYGNGMAERRIGDFLRDRDDWVLSTKVGRVLRPSRQERPAMRAFRNALPFEESFDFSYDGIMRSVETSFHRLGLNRIDILYVHDIGDPGEGTDTNEARSELLEGGQRALSRLKADGTVRAVGLGVNTVAICEELIGRMEIDLILLAGRYTLLDRTAEARLLPLCRQHGVRLVIGGVFNSGILATGPVEGAFYDYAPASPEVMGRVRELQAICARHDVPLAAAAVQFPGRNDLVVSTLLGTSKARSLERNIGQFRATLPAALWQDLEAARVTAPPA